ncbi:MAG: response regulator [Chthoniobacteraceae bacterium]
MAQILIVDDENVIAMLLREGLRRAGYAVATAANGDQGLEMALEMRPELVVSDVQMPGMDGFGLVAKLNTLMPETACILMSGHAFSFPESSRSELAGLKLAGILRKPFQMGVLLAAVKEVFDRLQAQGDCVPEVPIGADQRCA